MFERMGCVGYGCDAVVEHLESRRLLAAAAGTPGGVGVIGDSYSDEYQFYPPDRSTARNYVELLAQERRLDFGPFSTEDRGAPRRQGYAHNWALDGARSSDAAAQVAGLAPQVAAGDVDVVLVFIGGNDFRDVFLNLDPATATPEGVQAAVGAAVRDAATNVATAVATLRAAHPDVRLVVSTLPNVAVLPEIRAAVSAGLLPDALVGAVDAGIDAFNGQARALADSSPQIALADVDGLVERIFARRKFKIAGVAINRDVPGNDPTHLWLADGIHAGGVGQALLAGVFVDAMKQEFGFRLRKFRPTEILADSGVVTQPRLPRRLADPPVASASALTRPAAAGTGHFFPATAASVAADVLGAGADPLR